MRRFALVFTLLVAPMAAGQGDKEPSPGFWGKDLLFAAKRLPTLHKDLFRNVSKEKWKSTAIAFARSMDAKTPPAEFLAKLMRLVALVGDSHTAVRWTDMGFPELPLFLVEYADGVVVQKFPKSEVRLKGARILAVDGRPVEEVIEALRPLVSHDNDVTFRRTALRLLLVPALLRTVGIRGDDAARPQRVTLRLRSPKGEEFDHVIDAIPTARLTSTPIGISFETIPFCLERGRENYWWRYLDEHKALFIRTNRLRNQEAFHTMVEDAVKATAGKPVERVIVDLRDNGGGNSRVMNPLFVALQKKRFGEAPRVFAIIGQGTFSSAILNAITLKKRFHATFVGAPTAGRPNHFGEIRPLKLPNSGVTIYYSTKYFSRVEGDPPCLVPDVSPRLTATDYFHGKDAFLEACFQ